MRYLLIVAFTLLVGPSPSSGADWLTLRTDEFLFIGDAGERDLRDVALRFDQFREAVAAAVPAFAARRPGPPVVVFVFRNRRAFEPFMPRYNGRAVPVGGYYVSGRDVNYIALSADSRGSEFQAVYHEYAHLLLNRAVSLLPTWFGEGVAEYFSTFEVVGRDRANFGEPIAPHVGLLRERQMPLVELFAVTHDSPDYNEGSRRGLFYAQSWALVHYCLVEAPEQFPRLLQFIAAQAAGEATPAAFERAFGTSTTELDVALRQYVQRHQFTFSVAQLPQALARRADGVLAPITADEADAWLGDLLAHAGRTDEAATRLEQALARQPDLALAHASLGTIRMRQQRTQEGLGHLRRAVELGSQNEFVLFNYGSALVERAAADRYAPESRDALPRAVDALTRARTIRANFPEAGVVLGFAHLLLDDATTAREVLQEVIAIDPANERATYMLGQAELQLGHLPETRALLGPLVARAADAALKEQARRVLAQAAELDRQRQRFGGAAGRDGTGTAPAAAAPSVIDAAGSVPLADPPDAFAGGFRLALRERRPDEARVRGILTQIACTDSGIVLDVQAGARTVRAAAATLGDIDFISYRPGAPGRVECGARATREEVYLTTRLSTAEAGAPPVLPVAVAVELLPDGYVER